MNKYYTHVFTLTWTFCYKNHEHQTYFLNQWTLIIIKLENILFTFYMNCNAKRSSANIFTRAAHYMTKSRMWLASRGLVTPGVQSYIPKNNSSKEQGDMIRPNGNTHRKCDVRRKIYLL
jgi:hypothetical protein